MPLESPFCFSLNNSATTEIYTLSLHDALPIFGDEAIAANRFRIGEVNRGQRDGAPPCSFGRLTSPIRNRSEEHTSELQSHHDLVCRLLLEKKKTPPNNIDIDPPPKTK